MIITISNTDFPKTNWYAELRNIDHMTSYRRYDFFVEEYDCAAEESEVFFAKLHCKMFDPWEDESD